MVIFHSYVKLPEGTTSWKHLETFLSFWELLYIVLYAYLPLMPLQPTISQTIFGQPRQSFRSGEERITLNAHWRRTALVAE